MNRVAINDVGKLVVIIVALIGGIGLAIAGLVIRDDVGLTAGTGMATLALGYVFGNGRLAVRQEAPSTALAPMLNEHEFVRRDDILALDQARKAAARVSAKISAAKASPPPRGDG